MNKKNKILISAAGMLVLTAAAASASTFAWFTTIRNGSINYQSAEVYSSTSDLTIDYKSSLLSGISPTIINPQNIEFTSNIHRITDISGDGVSFYKPVWNASDSNSSYADSIDAIVLGAEASADGYLVDITLTLSQSEAATGNMEIYVGAGSSITAFNSASTFDQAARDCARIAILDDNQLPVFVWTPDTNDTAQSYSYIAPDTESNQDPWATQEGYYAKGQTKQLDEQDNFFAGDWSSYNTPTDAATAHVHPIATLYGTNSANFDPSDDITIRAWIEGQDDECKNLASGTNALGGKFNFFLNIYGIRA